MIEKEPKIEKMETSKNEKLMLNIVSKKINKRIHTTREKNFSWRTVYMFGLVGWEVVVPLFLMTYIGIWLEKNYPQKNISWTLNCIMLGFIVGFYNTYRILKKEKLKLDEEGKFNE